MSFIVYVLRSEQYPKSYVGMTNNMTRRFSEHNSGKSAYTKKFIPWKIVHQEVFRTRSKAREREKYLKSRTGRNFLKTLF